MAVPRIGWEVTAVPERLDSATRIETSRELFGSVVDLGIGGAVEQGKREEVQVLVQHLENRCVGLFEKCVRADALMERLDLPCLAVCGLLLIPLITAFEMHRCDDGLTKVRPRMEKKWSNPCARCVKEEIIQAKDVFSLDAWAGRWPRECFGDACLSVHVEADQPGFDRCWESGTWRGAPTLPGGEAGGSLAYPSLLCCSLGPGTRDLYLYI